MGDRGRFTIGAGLGAIVGSNLGALPVDAVASVLWSNLPQLFTVTSVAATTIAPEVPALPQDPLIQAAVVIGLLWIGKIALDILGDLRRRLGE